MLALLQATHNNHRTSLCCVLGSVRCTSAHVVRIVYHTFHNTQQREVNETIYRIKISDNPIYDEFFSRYLLLIKILKIYRFYPSRMKDFKCICVIFPSFPQEKVWPHAKFEKVRVNHPNVN